jgi:hypothetical protein
MFVYNGISMNELISFGKLVNYYLFLSYSMDVNSG